MERNQKIVLVAGGIITLMLFFIDIYLALIALVLVLVLLMSFHIMNDTRDYPLVAVELSENAREIIVTNSGTAEARNIHVDLVPLDVEFDIVSLGPDEKSGFSLASMIREAKAFVTYETPTGQKQARTYPLTALGSGHDPLEPMFPLFKHR
jgi:hypothetical protein